MAREKQERGMSRVSRVENVEDVENVVQQGMQDLYARRGIEGVVQKQPYGKSPDIYLSGVKCSLDKACQKSSATLHFRNNADQNATKDDGRRPCMNGRTVGSIMLPKRARMAASSQGVERYWSPALPQGEGNQPHSVPRDLSKLSRPIPGLLHRA